MTNSSIRKACQFKIYAGARGTLK